MTDTGAKDAAPLSGIRVLGVTRVLAGPYLEQLLGDMGAEVLHIEQPGAGDDSRHIPPFADGVSLTYLIANRNKKSITLNLKHPKGSALFKELVRRSHVLIESNRPGVMTRLGLDWEDLREVNPGLVMTSISGFGQSGPHAKAAGYNQIAQAAAGFMSLTGSADGPPMRTAAIIGDYLASLYGAFGTLSALRHSERTGEGQRVDVSLFESMVAILGPALQEYLSLGMVRQRTGNWAPTMSPSNVYPARDGDVMVVAGNDSQWQRLCQVMDRPDLAADVRFSTPSARVAQVDEVDSLITEWTKQHSVAVLEDTLRGAGIPCTVVNAIDGVVNHPQTVARHLIETVTHPRLGPLQMLAPLPQLSLTPAKTSSPPPELGEHNGEVYHDLLGLSAEEIGSLTAEGVI